ncbi:hypothetical protein ACHAXA_001558 [Cyclostephanos tholiformis]|uniref:Uncharacterized protein n=1 Tax=Cyclostephanos tholiformis TaxID=382380 RepID=A0ABD3R362_9STRA
MSHSSSSATQPLSDILPWGNPITVAVHQSDRRDSGNAIDDIPSSSRHRGHAPAVGVDYRTLLVTDGPSSDGRFLLHALALQFLSSSHHHPPSRHSVVRSTAAVDDDEDEASPPPRALEGAVLWIACTPLIERQIVTGLRRGSQHDLGGGNLASGGSPTSGWAEGGGRISIVSVPLELADAALDREDFSHDAYLRGLHERIVHWLDHRELAQTIPSRERRRRRASLGGNRAKLGPNLIVIDGATSLATLCGYKLTSMFLSSVRSSMKKRSGGCFSSSSSLDAKSSLSSATGRIDTTNLIVTTVDLLAIRVSSPDDGGLYHVDSNESTKAEKLRSEYARLFRPWLGLGSGAFSQDEDGVGTSIPLMEEQSNYLCLSPYSIPSLLYRSGLFEIADGIVDVSPLESGYARDVLGRLSFGATWSGKGWWGIASNTAGSAKNGSGVVGTAKREGLIRAYASICVNYRCDDSGVRVMRLRSR